MYLRNATAYGVSRRLRADIVVNNLVGHAVTTGKVLLHERRHAVASARPHPRHHRTPSRRCLVAPRDAIHDEAFNVGMHGENYRIRDVAEIVKEVVPGCEVEFAARRLRRTRATTASTSARSPSRLPGFQPTWTVRDGVEELYRAYTVRRAHADEWDGWKYYRLKTVKRLQEQGRIDEDLRHVHA